MSKTKTARTHIVQRSMQVTANLAILMVCVLFGIRIWNAPRGPRPVPPPSEPISIVGAQMDGRPQAPLVLIEYSDFECPFCGVFAREILPKLKQTYIDTGKASLIFMHRPLEKIHSKAFAAARAAACAGQQGQFWRMHDRLFRESQRLDEPALTAYADEISLDAVQFRQCLRSETMDAEIRRNVATADALGLAGTPQFLIGKRRSDGRVDVKNVVTGAKAFGEFAAVLDRLDASHQAPSMRWLFVVVLGLGILVLVAVVVRSRIGLKREPRSAEITAHMT